MQFFRLKKNKNNNKTEINRASKEVCVFCCIRRCSLVLSASSAVSAFLLLLLLLPLASAAGASAADAAAVAAAAALRTAGWSCSVFYLLF